MAVFFFLFFNLNFLISFSHLHCGNPSWSWNYFIPELLYTKHTHLVADSAVVVAVVAVVSG